MADKVVRGIDSSVLLVRVKEVMPTDARRNLIGRILASLDGSKTSEIALPYAEELARSLTASITLFRMTKAKALTGDPDFYPPLVL